MGPLQFAIVFSGFITYFPFMVSRNGLIDTDFTWSNKLGGNFLPFNLTKNNQRGVLISKEGIHFYKAHHLLTNWQLSNTIWITAYSDSMEANLYTVVAYMRHKKIKMTHKNFKDLLRKYYGDDYVDKLKTIEIRSQLKKLSSM
jgi:hypothetical protein